MLIKCTQCLKKQKQNNNNLNIWVPQKRTNPLVHCTCKPERTVFFDFVISYPFKWYICMSIIEKKKTRPALILVVIMNSQPQSAELVLW